MSKLQLSEQEKETSEFVSFMLNTFGYNSNRTKERIEALNIRSKALDIQTKHVTHQPEYETKIVGSLREGIGLYGISDIDTLQIDHGVVCVENGLTVDGKVTFHMVTDGVPQGYSYLKLQSDGNKEAFQRLKHALVEQTNGTYLSSSAYTNFNDDLFKHGDGFLSQNVKYLPKNGPSIPRRSAVYQLIQNTKQILGLSSEQCLTLSKTLNRLNYNTDVVHALPCIEETILNQWRIRKRMSDWPNADMVSKAVSLPVYVVPVGCKCAQDENLQWRISFVEAELYLVQLLNDTQRKVLILAKHITQNELKPISKHMKSYLVKMAVLWLAAEVQVAEFQQQHLMARLEDVLLFLKTSISNQVLPHYIDSKRNLLDGKLLYDEHKMLISKLEETVDNIHKYVSGDIIDGLEKFLKNSTPVFFNVLNIVVTNNVRRKTAEELAKRCIIEFKCHSLWSYLFYAIKDEFPMLYRHLGMILKHLVVPCYTEAQMFCFIVDEAFGKEQSKTEGNHEIHGKEQPEAEGKDETSSKGLYKTEGKAETLSKGKAESKDEQTFTEHAKQIKTRKNNLSDPPVKMNTWSNRRRESVKKILLYKNKLLTITDNFSKSYLFLLALFLTLPVIIYLPDILYLNFESILHAYTFWLLISFLDKKFRIKDINTLLIICIITYCYNYSADNFILIKKLIKTTWSNATVSMAFDKTCINEIVPIAHNKILRKLQYNIQILGSDVRFLQFSQMPDIIDNYIRLRLSSYEKT